jgi:23S rRNA pseudouridine2605 synthase
MTAAEAKETLGRELTEAAVLRALSELWQALRITPVLGEAGQPARWEMLRVRHRRALETGSTTSQVTALSLLVSMYLQSVYAATSEEIEVFLSPVTSRSRVREAVRGLSATRQIHTLSMDAQTYYFLENGLPEFAEVAAPAAPAETGVPPLPVQRPRPRKIQATARPDLPAAPPATPTSAPIFRRTKPTPGPIPASAPRPERSPLPRPAQPAARAGWKTPARPGSSARPAWKPAAKPAARGAQWAGRDEATRGGGKPRPASGSRPPFVPGRSANRPYVRPGAAAPDTRPAASPEARGGARPQRPGAWSGAGKRERPAPWALPGRKSSSAPRPPRPGGRGDSPFRPAQKHRDRPNTGSAREGTSPFPPRAPRGERGPGDPSRSRSTPGRPQDRAPGRAPGRASGPPSAYGANRSPAPYRSKQARPGQARSGEGRSGPPRGGRPSGPRPARFDAPRSGRPTSDRPRADRPKADHPRPDRPGRPFPRPSSPRPSSARPPRPSEPRPPFAGGADRGAKPRPNYDRPRPAGYARPGGKPGASAGGKGRSDRGPRPPFVPGSKPPRSGPPRSGPAKSWPRAGGSAAKPGKPSFRGRKPDRKKPGA